ncbi:EpsD family peptidyl-prolyl cis-trans isomerase [Leptothrix discophora]|uniref:EpsD family peptidyl-prolyl cis-trans isomerase n=1 Tax=Leptothrix discophora TaxID=89 RepID=A0ABT9G2F0_LEPDI|nr:EpsD family peptidyl-prolyl cis-trans isomerase [Leptothrix discophora]MDP4300667.1 EpsD family peptidyl-prolyl cis-trans isomerase [Leptothrix discophora]
MTHRIRPAARGATVVTLIAAAVLLAACGGGDKKGATQVAAKVNKEEISVHQINFVLQRQPGLPADQAQAAGKRVLEGLIDQELAIQEAGEQKLDRDPNVVMAIEAAKREIVARAYADKVANSVSKPGDDDIAAYYKSKPALFAERRVYTLEEFSIEAPGDAAKVVEPVAKAARTADELAKQLKAAGIKFASRSVNQPAENLPLNLIDQIGTMAEGQHLTLPSPAGVSVMFLTAAKPQPVSLDQAKPAIEQFLMNERKRKVLGDEMKRLRDKSKISYQGQFAAGAASAPQ